MPLTFGTRLGTRNDGEEATGVAFNERAGVVYHSLNNGVIAFGRITDLQSSIASQSGSFANPSDRLALAYVEESNILFARDFGGTYYSNVPNADGSLVSWTNLGTRTINGVNVSTGNAWIGGDVSGELCVVSQPGGTNAQATLYVVDANAFRAGNVTAKRAQAFSGTQPAAAYTPSWSMGVSGDELYCCDGQFQNVYYYDKNTGAYKGTISVAANDSCCSGLAFNAAGTRVSMCSIVGNDQWYLNEASGLTARGVRARLRRARGATLGRVGRSLR